MPVSNHIEHHKVRSQRFRDWLLIEAGREFPMEVAGQTRPGTFGKNAVEDALAGCEAMSAASEIVAPAPLRMAGTQRVIYLDLGDPRWRAAEITESGWRMIDRAPVPILRTRRTRPLPQPSVGGSLNPLRELLPIGDDDQWRVAVLWLLAALRPAGPYPILALSGEQGTGKSFTARVLRRLVDPSGDDIMQPPREDRDLIAAARGNHVLAFDNISSVSGELADSLCRLATGGDIGGRLLYTNDDSAAFSAQRPIIINGIPDLISRSDLVSRSLFIRLSPMTKRRTEADLWIAFDREAPGILGALLDVLSAAIATLPHMCLPEHATDLRMADFALLAMAAEQTLGWPAGSAIGALRRNTRGAAALMADLDAVAVAVRGLIEQQGEFTGLVSALLVRLNEIIDLDTRRAPGWPKHAARLGEHLRRLAPALRAVGIDLHERRGKAGMIVEISGDVGKADSLFSSYAKREEEGVAPVSGRTDAEVNSEPILPTPPTPNGRNGGVLPLSEQASGVGGVGGVGDTYTQKAQAASSENASGVGGVGEKPPEFIAAAPSPRRVRI